MSGPELDSAIRERLARFGPAEPRMLANDFRVPLARVNGSLRRIGAHARRFGGWWDRHTATTAPRFTLAKLEPWRTLP